jgi:hypothetical protein
MIKSNSRPSHEDGQLDNTPELPPRKQSLLILAVMAVVGLGVYGPYHWLYSPEQVCSEQTQVPYDQCLATISFARSGGW